MNTLITPKTKQGYEDWDYDYWGYGYSRGTTHDRDMDALHKSTLRGSHSFKFGMELNLTDNVAFRVGYNYYSACSRRSDFRSNRGLLRLSVTKLQQII